MLGRQGNRATRSPNHAESETEQTTAAKQSRLGDAARRTRFSAIPGKCLGQVAYYQHSGASTLQAEKRAELMDRKPPPSVTEQLRRHQGFVCVVPDCENPYLYYHHFDPPWRERQHHEPGGMVALCGEHHPKADAGAFTREQLHEYKKLALERAPQIKGKVDWLRHNIVIASGGFFLVENTIDVAINGAPALWFHRDPEGYALLNVRMPQSSSSKRVSIENNYWISSGNVADLRSPPGGKSLEVNYRNGDHLKVEFVEIIDAAALEKYFPKAGGSGLQLPVTAVEIVMAVPDLGLSMHAGGIGTNEIIGSVAAHNYVGVAIGLPRRARRT